MRKFKEWFETRHWIWQGILWIVGIILGFSVWLVLLVAWYYYSGTPIAWMASIAFVIIGFITLLTIYKASGRRTGFMRHVFEFFWVLPGIFWFSLSFLFIILYWQIFLMFFLSLSIGYTIWKLRKRETRAKLAENARQALADLAGYVHVLWSWAPKITHFVGTGIVIAVVYSTLTGAPIKNFLILLGFGAFLVILVLVAIVVLVAAPEVGLEGLASSAQSLLSGEQAIDWEFTQFLGACGLGLLLWVVTSGAAFASWVLGRKIWELKKRKEGLIWELEDQIKELEEKLSLGAITQEEYEQKKKLLEKPET